MLPAMVLREDHGLPAPTINETPTARSHAAEILMTAPVYISKSFASSKWSVLNVSADIACFSLLPSLIASLRGTLVQQKKQSCRCW